MFQNLFSKTNRTTAILHKNDKKETIQIEIKDTTLYLNTQKIPIIQISDITYKNKKLKFTYKNTNYKLEGELDTLYQNLIPISENPNKVFEGNAKYFIFENQFNEIDNCVVKIVNFDNNYYLRIEIKGEIVHFEFLNTDIQFYSDRNTRSFVWASLNGNIVNTFSLVFDNNPDFLIFLSKFLESLRGEKEDIEYFEKMEIDNYNFCDENENFSGEETEIEDKYSENDENLYEFESPEESDSEKNNLLVVDKSRAYVTRGSSLGVFDTEEKLKFRTQITGLEDKINKIIPDDHNLIMLDENQDELKIMNLSKGKIVDQWNVDRKITDFFGSKRDDNSTLVGLNQKEIFKIDPRIKKKLVENKIYKTNVDFRFGQSTEKGNVAVVSKKGDLRLYNDLNKRAKSLIPGFGDEIRGIDMTEDGQHIIITSKNYLMFYTVESDYKKNTGKPVPKRLQLKPEHLAYIKETISFTTAHYSKNHIITSTGSYVITWNIDDILKGKLFNYQIKKYNTNIVADNFKYGTDNDIIVTLPDDVRMISKDKLVKADRAFKGDNKK